ncbi:YdiU family protein [Kiloniella laminariae]|uniref:Protein nucleotidyltransferase YdiU n=1 Tax=Kiloniella laminariae TaxID=454162 RepID=A0ABT4LFF2_9PROT|nr:YdiU family protein [Kiloniella laminariae]MCZ4279836.1 YdiU family protein [Kiloniella laminariae]
MTSKKPAPRLQIPFDNSFARLHEVFYTKLNPQPVSAPALIKVNENLADLLGISAEALASDEGIAALAGNAIPEGAEPLAAVYAGHQFGGWSPRLGDGRAILLGEVIGKDGIRRDIQLKGSGRTPYSRNGDGRAALGPVLREYLVSEAMATLGIPTTRALAAVTTGDPVFRETTLPGAILTRVAQSHIRVGTFQYHYSRQDVGALQILLDHVIERHYPELKSLGQSATQTTPGTHPATHPAIALIWAVAARQAELVARWMQVGFIHGVMNTDNMSVAGETIDFGPCAFIDRFDPATVFSSIDEGGRYAWSNQPAIAHWNLSRLAQSLVPLLPADAEGNIDVAEIQEAVNSFEPAFQKAFYEGFGRKLGLLTPQEGDSAFVETTLELLDNQEVDFTLFFRHLTRCAAALTAPADTAPAGPASKGTPAKKPAANKAAEDRTTEDKTGATASSNAESDLAALFAAPTALSDPASGWLTLWHKRLSQEASSPAERLKIMQRLNPVFIPRNHRVEEMISAAQSGDFAPFEKLLAILSRPYEEQPENANFETPPTDNRPYRTFCGT